MIRDLLNPETGYLELREDSKGVQVPGIKEVDAHTSVDVSRLSSPFHPNDQDLDPSLDS